MVPVVPMCVSLLAGLITFTTATPVLWDGRAPLDYTPSQLNSSSGPYLRFVRPLFPPFHTTDCFPQHSKGHRISNARKHPPSSRPHPRRRISQYTTPLGPGYAIPATPLWSTPEQALRITIDNTSIFTPGSGGPQNGFRRTELIAQSPRAASNQTAFDARLEARTSVFHFSVKADEARPLNLAHEYQVVFIEPADGTHVFELQIGTPFNTTPSETSGALKIRSHDLTELFGTPFAPRTWHNFAVVVNWMERTLAVLYSQNGSHLVKVTGVVANTGAAEGAAGQGDFHFGVLKLPLVDPTDTPAEQADVVHFDDEEGLIYSGIFVEDLRDGISLGHGEIVALRDVL